MKKLNANVTAFTIGSPGDIHDESSAANFTAKALDIPHQAILLDETDQLEIDTLLDAFSEPFAAQSTFGILSLSHAIKPHATVLLTGDGADDIYLGYPHFLNAWRAQNLARRLPSFAAPIWSSARGMVQAASSLQRLTSFLD
jgi:asparagine synthase (glutamine-hydrolysing)